MKRFAFTLCALALLTGTAPAFAGGTGCARQTNASADTPTSGATTTASAPTPRTGG
ncbi:hypothetical protein V5F59_21595 [Xanthobacter autotrophicus DSM 431]|uniref:hypothetical protein n=1 Tax=Xanthobacter nonsaccharivorans TaxID=3119912 RepID=UPI003728647E